MGQLILPSSGIIYIVVGWAMPTKLLIVGIALTS